MTIASSGTLALGGESQIRAAEFTVGRAAGGLATDRRNAGTILLGTTNTIHADTLWIGDIKAQGDLRFRPVDQGSLSIRATDGESRATMNVGWNGSSSH